MEKETPIIGLIMGVLLINLIFKMLFQQHKKV